MLKLQWLGHAWLLLEQAHLSCTVAYEDSSGMNTEVTKQKLTQQRTSSEKKVEGFRL